MPKVRLADGTTVDVSTEDLFADDGTSPFVAPAPTQQQTAGLSADDITRILDERLNPLSSTINGLQEGFTSISAAEQARRDAEEAERLRREEQQRQEALNQMDPADRLAAQWAERSQALESQVSTLTSTVEQERQQREQEAALRQREQEFQALREYTQNQVNAHTQGDNADIAPQFAHFISGNTQEEVDASIARAQQATAEILQEFQQINPQTVQEQQFAPYQQPQTVQAPPTFAGSRAWSGPVTDPAGSATQQLTPEQIANMPMSDYAKMRPRLMGAASQNQNRGLFG